MLYLNYTTIFNVYVLLSFRDYFITLFPSYKRTWHLLLPTHARLLTQGNFLGTKYLSRSCKSTHTLYTLNKALQVVSSMTPVSDFRTFDHLSTLISFFFNYKYIFSHFFERMNKKIFKFSNYKVDRVSPRFVYIRPFNRIKHLIRMFGKHFKMGLLRSTVGNFGLRYTNFLFNRRNDPTLLLIHRINAWVFSNYKSTLFLRTITE